MKTHFPFLILMLLLSGISLPELLSQGPITPTNGFVGRSEVGVIYDGSGYENGSDISFTHTILSLKEDYEAISNVSNRFNASEALHDMDNLGNALINGVTGDFNGDGVYEYMVVSHGENNGIDFSIPGMSDLTIDSFYIGHIPAGPVSELYDVYTGNILVDAGDLTGNGKTEIAIAFVSETDHIMIHIFGLDEENTLRELHSFQSELLAEASTSEKFSISVDDLDRDGKAELLLVFYSSDPAPGSYLSIFSFSGQSSLVSKLHVKQLIDSDHSVNKTEDDLDLSFDIAAGDFDGDSIMEIAFGFSQYHEPGELFIFPMEVMDDSETPEIDPFEKLVYNPDDLFRKELNWNGSPLNLLPGDANGNGRDELIASGTYTHLVYTAAAGNLVFTDKYLEKNWGESLTSVALADLDNKEDNGKEILMLLNASGNYELESYTLSKEYVITRLAALSLNSWERNAGSGLLVTGDFDGDVFRIGEGVKYTKTDVVQPLVILNAPPTHFDQFGDNIFDVNYCHNGSNCESYATYTTTSSTDVSVSTTLRESWGVSATLKGGGKVLGFGVEAYMTGTYGKNFEKTSSSSETVTIQQSVTATYDDQIYATVCDYEIWEYKVYNAKNQPRGNIITLKPLLTENRWFPSKERSAAGYIPKHEVGNILSYTPYQDLINPDGEDKIRGSYGSDSYDLDANTDVTFSVNLSNTFNNTEVENREIGVEVGASVSNWGLELSGTASYNRSDLSTHSVSVGSALDISVHLGGVNRSIGETGYNVTPYIYWATSGAMVIDYAARPILPEPGGTNTWWSANYSKPDPAFILPWRLDPEKGLTLEDEARRYQTKSIRFSPAEPKAGDTITISAVINNFSPYPTASSVPVSFYVGDPMNGGTLITDIHGESVFATAGVIDNQAFGEVSFQWVVPENLESFPRIYGYINPMNTLSEVHERNNIGWAILGKSEHGGAVGSDEQESVTDVPGAVVFPNPFRNQAWIQYSLENYSDVETRICNLQGQSVFIHNQSGMGPGTHRESLSVEQLPAGVYFYSLRSSEFNYSGKILKVK